MPLDDSVIINGQPINLDQPTFIPKLGTYPVPPVQQTVAQIRGGRNFYFNADQAYRDSRENARNMRNNLVIRECLQTRALATAQLPFSIHPEDSTNDIQVERAEFLQSRIETIPYLTKYLYNLAENAIWFGAAGILNKFYPAYTGGQRWLQIKNWSIVHPDSLVYKQDSDKIGIYTGVGTLPGSRIIPVEPGPIAQVHVLEEGYTYLTPSERDALVHHVHNYAAPDFFTSFTAGKQRQGEGVRDVIYWSWLVANDILGMLVDFIERVGMGITIVRFLRGNAESAARALEIAESESFQAVLIFPIDATAQELEKIERIEPDSTGIDNMLKVVDGYFNSQFRRYIIGQEGTSTAVKAGMNSDTAKIHENTFRRLVRWDALGLGDSLTNQLVRVLRDYSFPGDETNYKWVFNIDLPEPFEVMSAVKQAWEMGVEFVEDEVRSLVPTMTAPTEDDKVVKKPEFDPNKVSEQVRI